MVRYICIYCNDMLDADDTIIDEDGPMCKDCYDEHYHEVEETKEESIPTYVNIEHETLVDNPIEETGLLAKLRRKKKYGDG